MQTLTRFEIAPLGDDFVVRLEHDGGGSAEVRVTPEQLDAMIELADDLLAQDDAAFEVDDDQP